MKVKYNLKNVHVAKQIETNGVIKYGVPKSIPGAVSVSLDAEGEISKFFADGIVYYTSSSNNGYSGDLEMAIIPDWFREEILNEIKDSKNVLSENATKQPEKFALLFEFDTDVKAVRRVMYNCICTRPGIESETKEENIEPGTEKLSIQNSPREDGFVKSQTTEETDSETYNSWYNKVYEPTPLSA